MNEMPTMASMAHAHSTYAGADLLNHSNAGLGSLIANNATNNLRQAIFANATANNVPAVKPKQEPAMAARRLVQVFIADPNENVPLEASVLYRGEQKLTDATDQELFFEIDMKSILEKHNAARVKMIDKKVKERTEYLEPAKIRDLKMVVVTVATF